MPQTAYVVDPPVGIPGLVVGTGPNQIITAVANEDIPFGRMVVIRSDGKCELPKSDAALVAGAAGVSVYVDTLMGSLPQGAFPPIRAGDLVPILRKGRIYASYSGGGAQAYLGQANVRDDAGTVATQGMFTSTVAAANLIAALGRTCVFVKPIADTTLCEVECNFA